MRSAGAWPRASPALQALVGPPMPVSGELLVREGATGIEYAGFYDRRRHVATVDEHDAQPDLVEHELAHAWFNDATFASTWMSEGVAEWAAREITGMAPCSRPPAADAGPDLGTWHSLDPRSTWAERELVTAQAGEALPGARCPPWAGGGGRRRAPCLPGIASAPKGAVTRFSARIHAAGSWSRAEEAHSAAVDAKVMPARDRLPVATVAPARSRRPRKFSPR